MLARNHRSLLPEEREEVESAIDDARGRYREAGIERGCVLFCIMVPLAGSAIVGLLSYLPLSDDGVAWVGLAAFVGLFYALWGPVTRNNHVRPEIEALEADLATGELDVLDVEATAIGIDYQHKEIQSVVADLGDGRLLLIPGRYVDNEPEGFPCLSFRVLRTPSSTFGWIDADGPRIRGRRLRNIAEFDEVTVLRGDIDSAAGAPETGDAWTVIAIDASA